MKAMAAVNESISSSAIHLMDVSAAFEAVKTLREQIAALQDENLRLRNLSHHDDLTGLGNRRSFELQLEKAIDAQARYGGVVTVLLIDLDGMKRLNDTCGHPAGDDALRSVGQVLATSLRGADSAARLGGDEFGVILPVTSESAAVQVAERLRAAIEQIKLPQGLKLTTSIGIAGVTYCSERGETRTSVLSRADQALYRSKRAGGNRIAVDGVHHLFGA